MSFLPSFSFFALLWEEGCFVKSTKKVFDGFAGLSDGERGVGVLSGILVFGQVFLPFLTSDHGLISGHKEHPG